MTKVKKRLTIAGIILGFLATAYSGFEIGYAKALYNSRDYACCKFEKGIEMRTENYAPGCAELENNGIPKIVKKNNDYFFVHATQAYFYVFGINIEPGKSPQVHWWGAGTQEALKQCVK